MRGLNLNPGLNLDFKGSGNFTTGKAWVTVFCNLGRMHSVINDRLPSRLRGFILGQSATRLTLAEINHRARRLASLAEDGAQAFPEVTYSVGLG